MAWKILAAVDSEAEGVLLRRKLRDGLYAEGGLELVTVEPKALSARWDGDAVAAIICTMSFRGAHRQAFGSLREAGFEGPALIIAKLDSPRFLEDLKRAPNSYFLERPFETRDLLGLVAKFAHEKDVQQRIHRRFQTDEAAEIEAGGVRTAVTVRDLSRGGARLESVGGPLPARGSQLLLKIALHDVKRAYAIPAKVVWVAPNGVGVEFLGGRSAA